MPFYIYHYYILVALNYQHLDKICFLNDAKFSDNGGCGYVLKPEFLRTPNPNYSPNLSIPSNICLNPKRIIMTIISGQHIPRPGGSNEGNIVKPYVNVKINGHPNDVPENEHTTDWVQKNGFNPFWNKTFQFFIKAPALAFLELTVKHKRSVTKIGERIGIDATIGAFTCPVNLLCEGKYHGSIEHPFYHLVITVGGQRG